MKLYKWVDKNVNSLKNKKIALTGATGGIGEPLSRYLLYKDACLILVDRNKEKSLNLIKTLKKEFPKSNISHITCDLANIESVKTATKQLIDLDIDIFIHNAGAYSIPRYVTDIGYDNVFQINFISPFYIIKSLMPYLKAKGGRVVATGSIAKNYSKTDLADIDFKTRKKANLVYGNAKRFLMYSLYNLFKDNSKMLSIVHPGITFTGITNHYPKLIFAIIKNPMKIIFMKPKKAALTTLYGIENPTNFAEWIGPRFFGIWGTPKISKIKILRSEADNVFNAAEKIYKEIINE